MNRSTGSFILANAAWALAALLGACGSGGGGGSGGTLKVVSIEFVDAAGDRVREVEAGKIPRNARLEVTFSADVDASSVNETTLRVAPGANSVPEPGRFTVAGPRVTFDPTTFPNGGPRPLGFAAQAAYEIKVPDAAGGGPTVRGTGGQTLTPAWAGAFATGLRFLEETVPPRFLSVEVSTGTSAVPGSIVPSRASLVLRFTEALDPESFELSVAAPLPKFGESFFVRYTAGNPANLSAGIESQPVLGSLQFSAGLDAVTFSPLNSYGDGPFEFTVGLSNGIRDLAGNALANPPLLGPFVCDGTGTPVPRVLGETFADGADADANGTTASWAGANPGALQGAPVTSRRVRVAAAGLLSNGTYVGPGTYLADVDPLVGAALAVAVPGIVPAISLGRRVMWAFSEAEIGASGAITAMAWGPDSNATFAATYPEVILRVGTQKTASMNLAATFSANYAQEPTIVYHGSYKVPQKANVGNETTPLALPAGWGQVKPLYDYTGYMDWPAPTSYFEWDRGVDASPDRVLLFDASVREGDTWQQLRGWFGMSPFPFPAGVLAPFRRLTSVFESDAPNPPPTTFPAFYNPDPVVTDTAFTIVRRTTIATSRFYTPGPSDPAGNAYPGPDSAAHTFGVKSDYGFATFLPSFQPPPMSVQVEYQGAVALDPLNARQAPDTAQPYTPWTLNVNACDGYPYLRWRLTLVADVSRSVVPRITSLVIPVRRLP